MRAHASEDEGRRSRQSNLLVVGVSLIELVSTTLAVLSRFEAERCSIVYVVSVMRCGIDIWPVASSKDV